MTNPTPQPLFLNHVAIVLKLVAVILDTQNFCQKLQALSIIKISIAWLLVAQVNSENEMLLSIFQNHYQNHY